MRSFAAFVLLVVSISCAAQQPPGISQYGQIFSDVSDASGKLRILLGVPNDEPFLKGFAAADNKGTFICNNMDSAQTLLPVLPLPSDTKIDFQLNTITFTLNETIVACGTVSLKQIYRNVQVNTQFRFAAWTSAIGYPNVKSEIPKFNVSWVDYCPQRATNCETSAVHPEPDLPTREASLDGLVRVHDCQGEASISSITVQIVLNTTDEGRNFNKSMIARDICSTLPQGFNDSDITDWEVTNDKGGKVKYSAKMPIKGADVSAYLYVCAAVDAHQGSNIYGKTCDDETSDRQIQRKIPITLQPDRTIHMDDIYVDFTH
jgi:hypothetical protein